MLASIQKSCNLAICVYITIFINVGIYSFYSIDRYFDLDMIIKYVFTTITSKYIFAPRVSYLIKTVFTNMFITRIHIHITSKTISSSMLNFFTEFISHLWQQKEIPWVLFWFHELDGRKKSNHYWNYLNWFSTWSIQWHWYDTAIIYLLQRSSV